MGNTNAKPPTAPATYAKTSAGGMVQNLQEDIICSICLEPFDDPVSIDCGHNFCRECLSAHWSGPSCYGYRCPECRCPCSRERMKPDTRLKSLVEKIGQIPLQELVDNEQMRPDVGEVPTTPLQWRQPVQIVGFDENGDLCLDEEALSHCLEQGEVKDAPVCLVSILGEQRRGKSFLLNFLLRRLQNLVTEDDSWMGQEDEPLIGFDWRPGPTSITKGVWLWNQPFWVHGECGKVAMFLIDTEGSMDLERSKEIGVKLSAFSMLLSSYQILNLATVLKDTDLEYLEMFVNVAETVGRACKLKPIQKEIYEEVHAYFGGMSQQETSLEPVMEEVLQLDVVVRDWYFPPVYGLQGGREYLQEVIQKLECQPGKHPCALEALKNTSTRCYLMPFPGKQLVVGSEGTLADMDDDFRECLKDYGDSIARMAGMHVKRNQEGAALTGAQLTSKIKDFSALMKQHQFGFSSTTEMAITVHNLETQEVLQMEFAGFIREQEKISRPMIAGLKVSPSSMAQLFLEKQHELIQKCERLLRGHEPSRTNLISRFKSSLKADAKHFLDCYKQRYKSHALKAGVAIGMGAIGLAGGVVGAGVAGAILAAEAVVLSTSTAATFAIGSMAGAGTFALVGGSVGAGVGCSIGARRAQEVEKVSEEEEAEEAEGDMSDERCLIDRQDRV